MRIAYLSHYSPMDIHRWSGTPYNVFNTLSKLHEVVWIGDNLIEGLRWHHKLLGRKDSFFPENYIEEEGRYLSRLINDGDFDFVITSTYHFCCKLNIAIPIIFYGDLTYDILRTYFKSPSRKYDFIANRTEKLSLTQADAIVYPSIWIAKHAIKRYGIDWRKVHVIEFGANIEMPLKASMPDENTCNLLFVGRNWKNKGGDLAYATFCHLKEKGMACHLTIVGCTPPFPITDSDVQVYPWLDKSRNKDSFTYNEILRNSHFLLLPTKFDAFGIVLCEANAHGTPCLATLVGGVGHVIKDGINGFLLNSSSTPYDYSEKIYNTFNNKECYHRLRINSRKEYENRLNWSIWAGKITNLAQKIIESNRAQFNVKASMHISTKQISTYVINLPERTDRREHIEKQFRDKPEFCIEIVEAERHEIGAVGLWKSICKVIRMAQERSDETIIICEDDHEFTNDYSAETLFMHINKAKQQDAEILTFGVGNFDTSVPVSRNLYWLKSFLATQFIVLYKPIFEKILNYDFKNDDAADRVLPRLSSCNMLVYPFMSIQHDFGYSDVTAIHNEKPGIVARCFAKSRQRMAEIHWINNRYNYYNEP